MATNWVIVIEVADGMGGFTIKEAWYSEEDSIPGLSGYSKNGVFDPRTNIWYPPHRISQVRLEKVEE